MWNKYCNIEYRMSNIEGGKIKSFTDLKAWQEGHKLVIYIYKLTREFPSSENYGLKSQMQRAAVSVTSNIAEGFGRKSYKEKGQFYNNSKGSLTELQNQILISKDIGYLQYEDFKNIAEQSNLVGRLLTGLIKATKNNCK